MNERFADVGPVRLCYETFGDPNCPTVLLVMGLGTQMVAWHEDFCRTLADRGFHVVRFDNRDVGRSTHLRQLEPPTAWQLLRRDRRAAHYTLDHMADDAARLLEALGVEAAHVVGASMGGMIAQTLSIRHPERVRSLVSIMSSTGNRRVGQPALRLYPVLLAQAPRANEPAFVEHVLGIYRRIGSGPELRDEDTIRDVARLSFRRGTDPAGAGRQLAAIIASPDRTSRLGSVTAPTLVVHGLRDRLVRPSGGRATASAIPGARLLELEGMGHDLPRGLWPQLLDAIAETASRAGDEDLRRAA